MKVLSLFDGMACGALALLSAGVEIESYDAFEYDEKTANSAKGRPYGFAALTASHNFPFIKQHGDVFKADFTQFEGVDLVCGGSPCTYWSIAQKNNRETVASGMGWKLFQQYVRAVKEAKPKFFIYENNKSMSKAIRASIDEAFGFEAVLINSALVSAQNRQRLYWVGRRNEDGTYSKVNVEQPEDRGIVLRDILESGVVDREKSYPLLVSHQGNARDYFKKQHAQIVCEPINTTDDGDKARTLMAGYYKYGTATLITNEGFKGGTTAVAEGVNVTEGEKSQVLKANYYKSSVANFFNGNEDKARPINALYPNNCGGFEHRMFSDNPNKQQVDMVAEPINIDGIHQLEAKENYIQYDLNGKGNNSQDQRIYYVDGKMATLSASGGDHKTKIIVPIRIGDIGSNSQAHRVYSCDGKSVTLSANGGGQGGKTGLYATPICHTIPQVVRVRKYTCDIEKFQTLLRESKKQSGLTNKDIAKKFNRPQTEVEHWFRTDKYFNIPDEDVWFDLKKVLNIETTEFDDFVIVFEEREGVFEKADRCYDVNGKMSTLMTGKSDNIIEPMRVTEATKQGYVDIEPGDCVDLAFPSSKTRRGRSMKEKSNCLMANSSELYQYCGTIKKPIYEVKDGFITIKDKKYPIKLKDGYYIIRKLTVRECMRLQTVPEWYEFPVSDSQAYKMLGNGWTVEVIAHLINSCLTDKGEEQPKMLEQMRFF